MMSSDLISRPQLEQAVRRNLELFPVTAIIGPRQAGGFARIYTDPNLGWRFRNPRSAIL